MPEVALLLAASAAIIGCAALGAALVANASMRRWRARCEALESHVATLGRELERAASGNGGRVQRVEREFGPARREAGQVVRLHGREKHA